MVALHRSALAGLHRDAPTPASVRSALQLAIEPEHSTCPSTSAPTSHWTPRPTLAPRISPSLKGLAVGKRRH